MFTAFIRFPDKLYGKGLAEIEMCLWLLHDQSFWMLFFKRPSGFIFNPFLANDLILCPLKIPENLCFSDVFSEYKMESLARKGLRMTNYQSLPIYLTSHL